MAESLKEKTVKGIAWGAVNNGTTQVLNLVFGIVLARKLSTEDYGLVALLTIFTALAGCIQAAGFSQALANLKTPSHREYNAVAWFNILAGCSMYVVLFFCAPLIAKFFDQPLLTDVSRLVFLTIPISAIGIVPNAILWIELRTKENAIIGIIALLTSGGCGVWMAFHGWAYWSLGWQQLIYITVVNFLRYYFTHWIPTLPIDFSPIRQMFRFSSKLLLTNILTVTNQNVLTFIFGKLFPISTVGQFSQANKWNTMANSFISGTMGSVAQPVFSKAGDDMGRQERVFRKMLRFTAFISFPCLFGLTLISREFILVTIGEKWIECIPLLQILCIGGAFMPFYTLYQNIAISHARSDLYMWCNIGQMAMMLALVLLLYPKGITAIVIANSILTILWLGIWQAITNRLTGIRLLDVLKDIVPFLAVSLLVMTVTHFITIGITNLVLLLAARIVIAVLLYAGSMKLLQAKVMEECINFLMKRDEEKERAR